jgi:hypothetical protein
VLSCILQCYSLCICCTVKQCVWKLKLRNCSEKHKRWSSNEGTVPFLIELVVPSLIPKFTMERKYGQAQCCSMVWSTVTPSTSFDVILILEGDYRVDHRCVNWMVLWSMRPFPISMTVTWPCSRRSYCRIPVRGDWGAIVSCFSVGNLIRCGLISSNWCVL